MAMARRWLWKSGRTKGGGAVPWNVQASNTDPANFIFEPDKTVVVAMLPGGSEWGHMACMGGPACPSLPPAYLPQRRQRQATHWHCPCMCPSSSAHFMDSLDQGSGVPLSSGFFLRVTTMRSAASLWEHSSGTISPALVHASDVMCINGAYNNPIHQGPAMLCCRTHDCSWLVYMLWHTIQTHHEA